jgi:glycosyltransferase involved in cell wall biosynthesis
MNISVVIPVYNEALYIGPCLESLLKQSKKPKEIIVIDNNSTDRTIEIVKQYPVKLIKEKKQGKIYARNTGFNYASSEIIARCDADCIVSLDWIYRIEQYFFKHKHISGLIGLSKYYDLPIRTTFFANVFLNYMKYVHRGNETLLGFNMAITQKIWVKVRNDVCLDEHNIHEDIDLAFHIHKMGGIIHRDKNMLVDTSARRIKKHPYSFFIKYPIQLVNTIQRHRRQ